MKISERNGIVKWNFKIRFWTLIILWDLEYWVIDLFIISIETFHGNENNNLFLIKFSDRFISEIAIPFLVIHSKDDPVCPIENMPQPDMLKNPNCFIIKTLYGGHVDFLTKGES